MPYNPSNAGGGYIDNSALASTAGSQLAYTDASIKRLMAAGFTQGMPNVARLTGVNVAKRTLAPTRTVNFDVAVGVGLDYVALLDGAISGIAGFPIQIITMQNAVDRAEMQGDFLAGAQVDIAVTAQVAGISSAGLSNDLEQLMGEIYTFAIFPTSGVQSPLVAGTSLREFAQTHRLAGPSGMRGTPPVRFSDQFAHCDLNISPVSVNTGARPAFTNGTGAAVQVSGVIAVRFRTFAG